MSDTTTISFDKQFKGLPVMNAETAWKVGTVTDLAIDSARGSVCGLMLISAEQQEVFLPVNEGLVFKESYLLNRSAPPRELPLAASHETKDAQEELPEILRANTDLMGASVVTERGELLGNISEVYLDLRDWQVFYRVTASWWQRWWQSGTYVPANRALRWSQTTGRLVVAATAKELHAARSPMKRVIA